MALLLISMTHVLVFNKSINYVYKGDLHHIGHTLPTTNLWSLEISLWKQKHAGAFCQKEISPQSFHEFTWARIQWADQGWAIIIAIYWESNILHCSETSENIAIPENIAIFLGNFLCMIISNSDLSWTSKQLQYLNLVLYLRVWLLVHFSLLLYLSCYLFVMN